MSEAVFEALFKKYLNDTLDAGEIARFRELFNDSRLAPLREKLLQDAFSNKGYVETADHDPGEVFRELLVRIEELEKQEPSVVRLPERSLFYRLRYVAAAVILVVALGGGLYFLNTQKHGQAHKQDLAARPVEARKSLAPGGNRAILTLANGQQIVLDSTRNGELSEQGNAQVIKMDSGLLSYTVNGAGGKEVVYNTISTPRGGQYQVILPDGTHVWLNSASSLIFPTSFAGKDRRVTLNGEGYFEVTKNDAQPFIVHAGNSEVTVLGTHFDIMAYSDEKTVNTTLLEGAVKVASPGHGQIIKPGYQAKVNSMTGMLSSEEVDVDRVVSWKNGLFDFKGADVHAIMRQVARWYDVQIEYQGDLSGIELSGIISRRSFAPQLLKLLEATERVRFVIQGDKIIVSPYK